MVMGVEVSVHEAKTHLSRLLDRVLEGEEVVIMRSGKRIARLSAVEGAPVRRKLGTAKGEITFIGDFDAPLPENVLTEFER